MRQTAIQSFVMSEGVPTTSWNRQDPLLKNGYHPGLGKVLPGSNIRICAPGSKKLLAVNEIGELHIGGTSVIRGCFGRSGFGKFHSMPTTSATGSSLETEAVVDEDGVLHIFGRYKISHHSHG